MSDEKKPCERGDTVLMGPEVGGGERLFVRHTAEHEIQMGTLHPLADGESIGTGSVLALEPGEQPGHFKVTDSYEAGGRPEAGAAATAKGPAKVNTPAYRSGWDALFGQKTVGVA